MTSPDCTSPVKRCPKCDNEYPATAEYFKHRDKNAGTLRARCRSCEASIRNQHYVEHREEICANVRDYQNRNKDKRREYGREYRERRGDDLKRAKREYYVANADTVKQKAAEYRASLTPEQRERSLQLRREYGRAKYRRPGEKEARRERERQYVATPRGKAVKISSGQRRRARQRGAGGTFSTKDLDAIRAGQTDKKGRLRCWWCGKPIEGAPHLDHKIALAAGGTNDAGNLCYACRPCNAQKWKKSPAEFAGRLL